MAWNFLLYIFPVIFKRISLHTEASIHIIHTQNSCYMLYWCYAKEFAFGEKLKKKKKRWQKKKDAIGIVRLRVCTGLPDNALHLTTEDNLSQYVFYLPPSTHHCHPVKIREISANRKKIIENDFRIISLILYLYYVILYRPSHSESMLYTYTSILIWLLKSFAT